MLHKIENEFLTCEIDDMGAQLHSLVSKENGKEYIWYGAPRSGTVRLPCSSR